VCGIQNESAFKKMRSLLMMHYSVREKAVAALGPQETLKIVDEIVARLRNRLGN
jgi:rRNA processing protein Krr1/Pno1